MSAKVPIYLKRGSRKGGRKERLRDLLSSDMISPPLGDFRHTIHVGSGGRGDAFGDLSFLQGKFHLLPRSQAGSDSDRDGPEAAPFALPRTATVSGRQRPAASAEASSPLLKNAISLPAIAGPQALTLPSAPPKPPRLHLDDKTPRGEGDEEEPEPPPPHPRASRFASPTNGFREEEEKEKGDPGAPFLSHAGSLLSLHLDLGPSMLEDVLRVMEKHRAEGGGASSPQGLLT